MTEVGKNKLNHPSLGTAGGSSLHSQMEGIFTTISDNLPARWKLYSAVTNGSTVTFEHNLQVPLQDLRLHIYTTSGGVQTRLTNLTGWTIQETSDYEQSKVDITVPSSGGPFDFYLYISHEPMNDKVNLAGDTMTGALTLWNDPGYPSNIYHAATKGYVDTIAQGLDPKYSVRAATTENITLSGTQTVDGVELIAGDRVLVKDQSSAPANGIYIVDAGGWTRSSDMDSWTEVPGAYVFIEEGTSLKDTGWVCKGDQGGTIGTTAIDWVQFAGVGTYTADGEGLELTGTQFGLELDGNTLSKGPDGLKLNPAGDAVVGTLQSGAVTLTSYEDFTAIPTPANPSAGKLRAYAKADNKLYTLNSSGIEQAVGSGGSIVLINKVGHGFGVADVGCPVYINSSGDYVKARADVKETAEVAGLINKRIDADNFEVCLGGEVTSVGANAASPLVVGELYFLSATTDGALTTSEPSVIGQISKPIGIARTTSSIEFFNMRGIVVGGTNARTELSLENVTTVQNIQSFADYEAGELSGWVYINSGASTSKRFYVSAQVSKNGVANDYNISFQTSGDTPPTGFALTVTTAGQVQLTLASAAISGFVSAKINYCLNAVAVGTTFPLSVDAARIETGTVSALRLPVASNVDSGIVNASAQNIAGVKTFYDGIKVDDAAGQSILNSFQEGFWSPSVFSVANLTGTPTIATATYTRIGNTVFARIGSIQGYSITTASSGIYTYLEIETTGLPGVINSTNFYGGAFCTIFPAPYEPLVSVITDGSAATTRVFLGINTATALGAADGDTINIAAIHFQYTI